MLDGVHTALVTPFESDGGVDVAALRRNVRFQIESGTAGLCPLGGTGEPLSMTLDEHRAVIDTVIEEVAGRVPVTVGCLKGGQAEIIEIARHARSAGATAIMVVTPYFYATRYPDIRAHFLAVAEAVDLPIVLFHSPGRAGVRLTSDEILNLIHDVPAIIAIKDASGDAILAAEVMAGAPDGFAFMQGLDELLLQTLALGAAGAVVSLGELLPRTLGALFRSTISGDLKEARRIQLSLMPLCRLVYSEANPGPLKHALALAGRPAGPCRPPIHGPTPDCAAALEALLPPLLAGEG